MTLGVPGTGPYSQINTLTSQIKANEQNLECNDRLSKKERKRLQDWVKEDKEKLKTIRQQIKAAKEAQKALG